MAITVTKERLAPIAPRTLRENATEIIRQSIIEGTLAPGAELNQAQLAEELGISRGPVREALGQLEQEGLIRTVPYKGVIITPLDRQYVFELYSVRMALETMALERAIERLSAQNLAAFEEIIDAMWAAARAEEQQRLLELDLHFHETIMQIAEHDLALKLWRQLAVGVKRCVHNQHRSYTFLDEVVGSHPTIVTAIAERNTTLAVQILRDHIIESAQNIVRNWNADDAEHIAPSA